MSKIKYSDAIHVAIEDSMKKFPNLLVMGQGVWSPFYVGNTMIDLDKKFSRDRVMDTPVSENAVTAMSLGVALAGGRSLVIHPRMDFLILASDSIVNTLAKWRYSLGLDVPLPITIRTIINRGGEQGSQHSQALYSWFAHIPGLTVVIPSCPQDAYNLLRQSLESQDPVIFVEDRWDYDLESNVEKQVILPSIRSEGPRKVREGSDITIWGVGNSTNIALVAAERLEGLGISAEVIDQRVISPFQHSEVSLSVAKTRCLLTVENAWPIASISSHLIASVCLEWEGVYPLKISRLNLTESPAPTSRILEDAYYRNCQEVIDASISLVNRL